MHFRAGQAHLAKELWDIEYRMPSRPYGARKAINEMNQG